jgi:uncharacterized membrane protein
VDILFNEFGTLILFLHILSAVIWVGGMIAIRFAVHPVMQTIDSSVRLEKSLSVMKNLFNLVALFTFLIVITGIIMVVALDIGKVIEVHIKEGIWSIMILNFIFMYMRRAKAQMLLENGNVEEAKKIANLISSKMLPVNLALGVVAIFFGVMLRGF